MTKQYGTVCIYRVWYYQKQMMCHWFSMTKRMSKLNCGGHQAVAPTHLREMKTTVILTVCKTSPQPWQGTLYQHIQYRRTGDIVLHGILPSACSVRVVAECLSCGYVSTSDGDLYSGLVCSRSGRVPICPGCLWQRVNRRCSLYAPWHGH